MNNIRHITAALKPVLCLMLCLTVSLSALAQKRTISINAKNQKVSAVLRQIERQSGFTFFYSDDVVDLDRTVSVSASDKDVLDILKTVFSGTTTTASIVDGNIVLSKGSAAPKTSQSTMNVTGFVLDKSGLPVVGAGVVENGTTNGTVTDLDGRFSLTAPANAVLQISCIGYTTQDVALNGRASLSVALADDNILLNECVVVGYGIQKKVNLSGAVDMVTSTTLENRPTVSPTNSLQGAVANLNITTYGGNPSDISSLNIRGYTSVNGGSPLVVIDGVQSDNTTFARMNAADIESVSVLKDAAACAIYGSQAAFGVILVTTKSGSNKEKVKVSYNNNLRFRSMTTTPMFEYDPYTVADIINKMHAPWGDVYNSNDMAAAQEASQTGKVTYSVNPTTGEYAYWGQTNWKEVLYKDFSPATQHDISVSGGTDRVSYYLSGAYDYEEGMYNYGEDKWNQFNVRAKVDVNLTRWWKLSTNLNYTTYTYDEPYAQLSTSLFTDGIYRYYTTAVPFHEDGTLTPYGANYVGRLQMGGRYNQKDKQLNAQVSSRFDIIKDVLFINATYKYNVQNRRAHSHLLPVTYYTYPGSDVMTLASTKTTQVAETDRDITRNVFDIYASYQQTLAKKHFINAVIGFNQEEYIYDYINMGNQDLISNSYPTIQLTTGEKPTVGQSQYEWATRGAFGRINYVYDDRYIIEFNARYDGTSRFRKDRRFAFNPSASAAWNIANERWFAPVKPAVNLFKVRASYGSLGNQDVDAYAYIDSMSSGNTSYLWNGETSKYISEGTLVTGNLTWETVTTRNLGLDLGFLDNRLNFTGDIYVRETKGMLSSPRTVPAVMAASAPKENTADLETKGWEFTLSWKDSFMLGGKPFNYSIRYNLSDSRAWITKWEGNDSKYLSNNYEGKEIGEIWGFVTEGYFTSDADVATSASQSKLLSYSANPYGAGDIKFMDLNNDGEIYWGAYTADDPGDLKVIGNSRQRYCFGLNLDFQWNGFDLSTFIQGVGKQNFYPGTSNYAFWSVYIDPWTAVSYGAAHDHWTEDNTDAYFPRLKGYTVRSWKELGCPQTKYLQNCGYARLKNVTFGYTLPQKVTRKAGIDRLRFYFSGENLAVISGLYKYYKVDPENIGQYYYPNQRVLSLGLNLTF